MCLAAYAFGRVTRTEWVWWLAPITVAVDGSRLFRSRAYGSAVPLSVSELRLANDAVTSIYMASSFVAAGVAAWGAYTGNRPAIILGAIVAIVGRGLEREEDPACEHASGRYSFRRPHNDCCESSAHPNGQPWTP
ncbi:MAG TPA: hypothetical protein VJ802_07555 [Gemmatimonadaceae bacterium]|nr:hypothetical protein [Gemmatimonadaceae bacterium]